MSDVDPPLRHSLPSWQETAGRAAWRALLLGNGLSINVWEGFAYGSLYERARVDSKLRADELALFKGFATENFEVTLDKLNTAIRVLRALGGGTALLLECYRGIQAALGESVRSVHIPRATLPDAALATIKRVISDHETVFTTNYDLLAYWAMGYGEEYGHLADLFWTRGPHGLCQFDPANATVWPGRTALHYLHGALHLVVHSDGTTRKLTRTPADTILEQLDAPATREPSARPLLISGGTAHEKLRAIEDNVYLSHALDRLYECELPLVVFGSSLSDGDRHLFDAINAHPARPVAVSMIGRSDSTQLVSAQGEIRARLHAHKLFFFDAATHPLGNRSLRATSALVPVGADRRRLDRWSGERLADRGARRPVAQLS